MWVYLCHQVRVWLETGGLKFCDLDLDEQTFTSTCIYGSVVLKQQHISEVVD